MASTVTIQNTINWASSFIEQQPMTVNGMEPALSSANLVMQAMLNPPFAWPWNRGQINFTAVSQDTVVASLNNFGFLEGGSATPSSGGSPFPLSVVNMMQNDASGNRPNYVSALLDDGAGNITFRLVPSPDQNYVVNLIYQKKAPFLQSLGYTWSPVPDEKRHIFQWGFLSLMSLLGNDARFNEYNQKFIINILAAQGGLQEMERNVWLGNWTRVISQLQATDMGTRQRFKAREG